MNQSNKQPQNDDENYPLMTFELTGDEVAFDSYGLGNIAYRVSDLIRGAILMGAVTANCQFIAHGKRYRLTLERTNTEGGHLAGS